jgi:pimeloyl-ACP methyl ester carboxylesterase
MPVADIDGAEIHYEVIGQHGPWMTAIPGGRHPLCEVEDLASGLADHGFRVLTHDRRNCGRSSLSFDGSKAEEDIWVEDLRRLLDVIGIDRTSLVGRSRSSRMAVWFSLSHPTRTHGIGLWGFSGGAAAVRLLDDYYYGQYIRACENGGMAAVCSLDHFAGIIDRDPGKRHALLALNPDEFIATLHDRHRRTRDGVARYRAQQHRCADGDPALLRPRAPMGGGSPCAPGDTGQSTHRLRSDTTRPADHVSGRHRPRLRNGCSHSLDASRRDVIEERRNAPQDKERRVPRRSLATGIGSMILRTIAAHGHTVVQCAGDPRIRNGERRDHWWL